jgi:hypothetical protein
MQDGMPLPAKLAISFGCALVTSAVAMWYWTDGKGRPLQSSKSKAWLAANILVMAAISTGIGNIIPAAESVFWLKSALLPAALAGSKSLEDVPAGGSGGSNPLAQLVASVFELASWIVAPLRTLLGRQMRHDMLAWVETINGKHRPYNTWTWQHLLSEARQLFDSLSLYMADEKSNLGTLQGVYDLVTEGYDLPPGPARDVKLRHARTAFAELRRLAYIWGYDFTKPAGKQSGKGFRKFLAALKPSKEDDSHAWGDDGVNRL